MSYLNTKPLLYGIKHHPVFNEIELVEDYPALIAQMLINGTIDVGLVPVAATVKMRNWHIVGDYCIGCDGPVASVCLFSDVPMEKIERVLLDYQSRTSVNLAKILLAEFWKKDVQLVDATGEDFRAEINGTTAGVVIGDRALEQRSQSKFIYDLGEAWKAHTGLPFVFAAWISNKELPTAFSQRFNAANEFGLTYIDDVVKANPFAAYDLKAYFTSCIQYKLTPEKMNGMHLFLTKLQARLLQPHPVAGQ